LSDFSEGETVRYWEKSGGWRFGLFVRTIESRTGKDGLKKPNRGLVKHGNDEVEVPLQELKRWASK